MKFKSKQKTVLKIFNIKEQYIIPEYQKPYAWEYKQCFQLFNDLMRAYKNKEYYFIGNVIFAKSEECKNILKIIDGQQRITTLLLFIKVLYIYKPECKVLNSLLQNTNKTEQNTAIKLKYKTFEINENNAFKRVMEFKEKDIEVLYKNKDKSIFESNILYFYNWLKYNISKQLDIDKFIYFLLNNVYLNQIKIHEKSIFLSNKKAFAVYEIINKKGINLEAADIFKTALYNKAKKINEGKIFLELWNELRNDCENINLKIDDIFKYYSHIIRGKNRITANEINLRNFFIREKYSPLINKSYKTVLNDLFKIIEIIEFINRKIQEENRFAKWLQLIELYSNRFPKYAVVTYLFVNDLNMNNIFLNLLKSLVRFIYYQGATTKIKFEIFAIIGQITLNKRIKDYYISNVNIDSFNTLGRLKYGFALLSFYLNNNTTVINYKNIDKLIKTIDIKYLPEEWECIQIEEIINSLGNFVVLDIPKKNIKFKEKKEYYQTSKIAEVRQLFNNNFTYKDFLDRDMNIKLRLVKFFKGTN